MDAMTKSDKSRQPPKLVTSRSPIVSDIDWSEAKRKSRESIAEQIKAQVLQLLIRRRIKAGEYFGTEADLAEAFGTSRLPVRDAVQALQALGLLETRVGKGGGIFIARPNPESFEEALAIQAQLLGTSEDELLDDHEATESFTAALAAERATPADVARLEDILASFARALAKEDRDAETRHLMEFHVGLAEVSRNRILMVQMQVLMKMAYYYFKLAPKTARSTWKMALESHEQLLSHIRAGDADAARRQVKAFFHSVRANQSEWTGGKDG